MRARLLDVVRPEPPVEADRGVQAAEDGVLWLREARHPAIMAGMEVVVRSARPEDAADGLLYLSAAPYYAAYAGGAERARRLLAALYPLPRPHRELAGLPRGGVRRRGRGRDRRLPHLGRRRAGAPLHPAHADPLAAVADAAADAPPAGHRRRRPASRPSGCSTSTRSPPTPRTAAAAWRARCSPTRTGWPRPPGSTASRSTPGWRTSAPGALYERAGFTPTSLRPAPDERTARALGGSGFVGYVKRRAGR